LSAGAEAPALHL